MITNCTYVYIAPCTKFWEHLENRPELNKKIQNVLCFHQNVRSLTTLFNIYFLGVGGGVSFQKCVWHKRFEQWFAAIKSNNTLSTYFLSILSLIDTKSPLWSFLEKKTTQVSIWPKSAKRKWRLLTQTRSWDYMYSLWFTRTLRDLSDFHWGECTFFLMDCS